MVKTQLSTSKGNWKRYRATTPHITFQLDPQNKQKYHCPFPHQWMKCSGRNPQCLDTFSLQFPLSSLQPSLPVSESVWTGRSGISKLKGRHLLPHTGPFPFSLSTIKNTHTHLFPACWYFNHQHLNIFDLPRGDYRCMFDPCNDYSAFAFPRVTVDGSVSLAPRAQELTWRIVRRSVGRILRGFFIRAVGLVFSLLYSAGGSRRLVSPSSLSYSCPDSAGKGLLYLP